VRARNTTDVLEFRTLSDEAPNVAYA